LSLVGSKIANIPDNLAVLGNLDLDHTEITELPRNLYYQKFLYITYTNIKDLSNINSFKNIDCNKYKRVVRKRLKELDITNYLPNL
jgi:hypothetical protein